MQTDKTQPSLNIAAVERDTGLSKDTLRVWERRYGFPTPARDANGDRLYALEQVEKLRLIRRLLDQGRRPAKIVPRTTEELMQEIEALQPASAPESSTTFSEADFLQLVRLHRHAELRSALQQLLLKQGLQRFVAETVSALNVAVGESWMRGELDVPEEHLYSEQVQNVLRNAIGTQANPNGRPRVLLTTFPDELHGLGLLMAEAMLVPEGASCVSLGTQTPLSDLYNAATANDFDVVALSFSGAYPLRQAVDGLRELRQRLPGRIVVWAGGAAFTGRDLNIPGVTTITSLDEVTRALTQWRAASSANLN